MTGDKHATSEIHMFTTDIRKEINDSKTTVPLCLVAEVLNEV